MWVWLGGMASFYSGGEGWAYNRGVIDTPSHHAGPWVTKEEAWEKGQSRKGWEGSRWDLMPLGAGSGF